GAGAQARSTGRGAAPPLAGHELRGDRGATRDPGEDGQVPSVLRAAHAGNHTARGVDATMSRSLDELIQLVLDGAASPEERTHLERLLERDPQARRRHAELSALFAALGSGEGDSEPPGLAEGVMRALPSRAPATTPG